VERQEYIDELLVKSLLGEADEAQEEFVRNWRKRSSDNERYCSHFEWVWKQSKELAIKEPVDVDAAWMRFQSRIAHAGPKRIPLISRSVLRIAAGLFLLLGITAASYLWWTGSVSSQTADVVLRQELPDGSFVTMNKHSRISFPRHFTGGQRKVKLAGEAFFSVAPDKEHPFLIEANGVLIKVVGTSFNVKTSRQRTEVIVETGIVEVMQSNKKVSLQPKDRVYVAAGTHLNKERTKDKLYNYYRTNEFSCDHTPLSRLVSVLQEAYGKKITIVHPEHERWLLTGDFKNDGLTPVLSVVCETLNLQFTEKDGIILID
jgi:ferric-dicitrate binding protein FerR (iron transport regulator)